MERWYPRGQTQPDVSASAWDTLYVNDTYLPGRCRITRAAAAWKVDPKKKPGADADRPTITGFDARPIAFEVLCATVDQADLVNAILEPYIPAPGATAEPIRIAHPSIAHLKGVKSMQILEASEWSLSSGRLKLTVSGTVWVGGAKKQSTDRLVQTPTRTTPNARRRDAEKRGLVGGQNPAPASQANFCAPNFTPAS